MVPEFQHLQSLLQRSSDDLEVVVLIGEDSSIIQRDEYYGSVEFRNEGVDVVFKEAPWVVPTTEISDPKKLHVSGFHFHRKGHEGYNEYSGHFPGGVTFSDSETEIRRKLGQPLNAGGGEFSSIIKKPIPRWLCYGINHAIIHFQLDENGLVEMVTLFAQEPKE